MSKLRCTRHGMRVHVWNDGLGALTVHRSDGSRCVVNPTLTIAGRNITPTRVIKGNSVDLFTRE